MIVLRNFENGDVDSFMSVSFQDTAEIEGLKGSSAHRRRYIDIELKSPLHYSTTAHQNSQENVQNAAESSGLVLDVLPPHQ